MLLEGAEEDGVNGGGDGGVARGRRGCGTMGDGTAREKAQMATGDEPPPHVPVRVDGDSPLLYRSSSGARSLSLSLAGG